MLALNTKQMTHSTRSKNISQRNPTPCKNSTMKKQQVTDKNKSSNNGYLSYKDLDDDEMQLKLTSLPNVSEKI